jgi:Predicted exporters of the RND superfamily
MWYKLALFILRFRIPLLLIIFLTTGVMGYYANRVRMSYDMASAIPSTNPKFKEYLQFKKMFGEDGTIMVIGFDKKNYFDSSFFVSLRQWKEELMQIEGVENILSIPTAVNIIKKDNEGQAQLGIVSIFSDTIGQFDIQKETFLNLPFYKYLLYNPDSDAYLHAVYLNSKLIKSEARIKLVQQIKDISDAFATKHLLDIHYSGLPFIRTQYAESVKYEMNLILMVSLLMTCIILLLFFRSFSAMWISLSIVLMGVVWALGIIAFMHFKITILTALVAPLIVVIGVPNCIYFINKYHTLYTVYKVKRSAILGMIERMGVVTLFTNLTAAIGFGVFYFTESTLLKEFGFVAGVSILIIFLISLIVLPALFSFLPAPKDRHISYLNNKYLSRLLMNFERWVFDHPKFVFSFWGGLLIIAMVGMSFLKPEGRIVDDLPKKNILYKDLKYFEQHFKGVMPLEILIDTRKKQGAVSLQTIQRMDKFSAALKEMDAGIL